MIVRENIEFKRGIDPKKSLEIGENRKFYINDTKGMPTGYYMAFSEDDPNGNNHYAGKWNGERWIRIGKSWKETKIEAIEDLDYMQKIDLV